MFWRLSVLIVSVYLYSCSMTKEEYKYKQMIKQDRKMFKKVQKSRKVFKKK